MAKSNVRIERCCSVVEQASIELKGSRMPSPKRLRELARFLEMAAQDLRMAAGPVAEGEG